MKKLSLKNATNMLSRKEMKAISGGYGGYGNDIYCTSVKNLNCEEKSFCSQSSQLTQSWQSAWISLGWGYGNWCHST